MTPASCVDGPAVAEERGRGIRVGRLPPRDCHGSLCVRDDCWFRHPDGKASDVVREKLRGFRDRYPMDDEAFNLSVTTTQVQNNVLQSFRPLQARKRDYSAQAMSFVRSVESRQMNVATCPYGSLCLGPDCGFLHPDGKAADGCQGGSRGRDGSLGRDPLLGVLL